MIELINVKKKFKKRLLFEKVNIKIDRTGIYSFVGENGSGKSTLLNIICGFVKATSGKVVNKSKYCSYISQEVNLIENMTVKEHFEMFNLDVNLLKKINMFSKVDKYPKELSFGMRQRISVLIGLYSGANVIVCDEPISHLDKYNSNILMREIKKISKSKIIFLVCHDEKTITKYSDEIYEIKNKRIAKVKNDFLSNKIVNKWSKTVVRKKVYFKSHLKKDKRTNFFFFTISFLILLVVNLTFNVKNNFFLLFNNGEINSLDYNKFYLKECVKEKEGKLTIKKCSNLQEDKINLISVNDNLVSLNYDVLLNDLYDEKRLNVINNKKNIVLKEGRYPSRYSEVIASSNYVIGQEITIESFKIINDKKTDIYKNKMILKVVGISKSIPFIKDDKLYFDYTLIERYLKSENLINNKISLYEYFNNIEINDYKFVIYFNKIDLKLLKDNQIEYLSQSYEYYVSLEKLINEIIDILNFINIFIILTGIFYSYKNIKKKIKKRNKDILFFKANGIKLKDIVNMVNKDSELIIVLGAVVSFFINVFVLELIFEDIKFDFLAFFFSVFSYLLINKKILKREIEREMRI